LSTTKILLLLTWLANVSSLLSTQLLYEVIATQA
jgi:hypothetical protein